MATNHVFVPSPIEVSYTRAYRAITNKSGRMQYYVQEKGKKRVRITRTEFLKFFNSTQVMAMRPIQEKENPHYFQFEFYIN